MKRTGLIILVLALIASAALIFGYAEAKKQRESRVEKAENASAYNEKIGELWQEKRELELKIQEVEKTTVSAGENLGSVVLLFAEPDSRLEMDGIPLLADFGFSGVIALSLGDFAEDAQRLSNERLLELQEQGWELCLSLGASEDLSALCRAVRQAGLKVPKTLYLPESFLTETQSVIAQQEGVTVVVQHSGAVEGETCYGLPCILATGSHESLLSDEKKGQSKELLAATAKKSGGLVLTIGYNRVRDSYDENNVSAMLRGISNYVKNGKLAVSNCVTASERMATAMISVDDAERINREQLAELREKLDAVNEQIKKLS